MNVSYSDPVVDDNLKVSFDILSINTRGIRDSFKRHKVFEWLKNHTSKNAVIFIQESHSTADIENLWSQQWHSREKLIFSHGDFNARGVLVAFRENLDYQIEDKVIDEAGRYIILKCRIQDSPFLLVNLYNPNIENERVKTMEKVKQEIDHLDPNHDYNTVIGGDFNFIQDSVYDADGGSPRLKLLSIAEATELQNSLDLVDIWRIRNLYTNRYTFRQPTPFLQRRLDYFLVSDCLQDTIELADIIPAVCTDHSAIVLRFSWAGKKQRGLSYWKFNNSLLLDNVYMKGMRENIEEFCNLGYFPNDPRMNWEYLKFKIKKYSRQYSIQKKKKDNARRLELEAKLKSFGNILNSNSSDELIKEYEDCTKQLENFYDNITNGLIIRSKADWYEKGEKSNSYFFNLEKRNKSKTHVKCLLDEKTDIVTHNHNLIMKSLKSFYRTLYTRKSCKTEKQCSEYLDKINTPVLTPEERDFCEGQLTLNEIFKALNTMPPNKTPGSDGLTKEFYLAFFDLLGPTLLKCINYAFSKGELSASQRQAVITLIEKKEKDKRLIKNWRPISLLNVDAKVISKCLANRVKKVIPSLISSDQTAYVPGRYIGESVRLTSDLLEYTNIHNLPGILLTIDIEKAFDSVDHIFLCSSLKKYGFGTEFIQWIKLILNKQESCILNDGHSAGFFPLSSGTRQGDPISAFLFILVIEILFIQIRNNRNIKGISIFGFEFKLSSFADDVSYFLQDLNSAKELLKLLGYSQQFTSLRINCEKSKICGIGSKKGVIGAFSKFRSVNLLHDCVKILGYHHSYNKELAEERNFVKALSDIQNVLNLWSMRGLSLLGRVQVLKALGISKIEYISSMAYVPKKIIGESEKLQEKFLWKSSTVK